MRNTEKPTRQEILKTFKEEIVDMAKEHKTEENILEDGGVVVNVTLDEVKESIGSTRLHAVTLKEVKKSFTDSGMEILEKCPDALCIKVPKEKLTEIPLKYGALKKAKNKKT